MKPTDNPYLAVLLSVVIALAGVTAYALLADRVAALLTGTGLS